MLSSGREKASPAPSRFGDVGRTPHRLSADLGAFPETDGTRIVNPALYT
jgi:hypothetical protein